MTESHLDLDVLGPWMAERMPAGDQELASEQIIGGGATNEIFILRRGGHEWVLRRPTPGRHANVDFANRTMLREFQVLSALEGTNVPHPKAWAVGDDPALLGSCFYIMDKIDGFAPRDPIAEPWNSDPDAQREMSAALVDGIAELANVDYLAVGLDGFGKPDKFLERQADRWLTQLKNTTTREIPHAEAVSKWLAENVPPGSKPGIMHGDYQFINVMMANDRPGRLAAIVDWEQSTIGDPLLDLGWLLGGYGEPGERPRFSSYTAPRAGFLTRREMVERYVNKTGRDVTHLDYYVVLAWFKMGCVLEGAYTAFVTGKSTNPAHESMGPLIVDLMQMAQDAISGSVAAV